MDITLNQAKKLIKQELEAKCLPFTKLTARTVGFSDLARAAVVFVTVHGWKPNPQWDNLKAVAKKHDFCLDT